MRALISVFDKSGVLEFARELEAMGWELISSGGTASMLRAEGVAVSEVADITGAPEMLDGRVKTLHPVIHGGILADRSNPAHVADLEGRDITPIDLVVCNLYAFRSNPSVEMIDVGGPTMVRAAAKNHDHVGVVVDPDDYGDVVSELRSSDTLSRATRVRLARKAFAHTAGYDASIVGWLDDTDEVSDVDDPLPDSMHLALERVQDLRYGENPHQVGARFRFADSEGWWDSAQVHQGKELSYLNVYDAEAAWSLVWALGAAPTAVVIKHANPCGAAQADDVLAAYRAAHECDPISAFGGIVAVNQPVSDVVARAITEVFTEVLIAPGYDDAAREILATKPNLRVLEANPPSSALLDVRSIDGGLLVQTADRVIVDRDAWQVVTDRAPTDREWADLEFAWRVAARVSSNTIVLAKDQQAVGIGAGQQNRRDAGRIAAEKADGRARGGACASDAFFPFRDGLDAAIDAGATAVVQPGGSVRDEEVIAAADEAGLAMVFTGQRHFKH